MPIPLGILAVAGAGAAGAGAFDLLETTVLSSDTASVTFSNLNNYSSYKHLQIRMTARSANAATTVLLNARFNSDSGSNYAWHRLYGNGGSVQSESNTTQTSLSIAIISGASSTANVFSAAVVDILDFSSSSKNTTTRGLDGVTSATRIQLTSGFWNNTAAVTNLQILPSSGNLVSGSRFSLYGIK